MILTALLLATAPASAEVPIWERIVKDHGLETWSTVEGLQFTWTHVPSGKARTYDWELPTGQVTVTLAPAGEPIRIPTSGEGLTGDALAAHQAFVNDSYWLLFELKATTDPVVRADLPAAESPFGPVVSAYEVRYAADGGYTPGDRYVVFVGAEGRPSSWSYFPGGAETAKLSTTRSGWTTVGGLTLPTQFDTPDGSPFIRISDLAVRREAAPGKQP